MSVKTEDRTFIGLPVTGDYEDTFEARVPQRPKEELGALLSTALHAEGVVAIQWRQYTPYFNDGEACHFGVHTDWGAGVKLEDVEGEDGQGDAPEGYLLYNDVRLVGGIEMVNKNRENGWRGEPGDTFPRHPAADAVENFFAAIDSGAFHHALQEVFGDHCTVNATSKGFQVEFYEHD